MESLFFLIIGAVIPAYLAANLAQKRNRSEVKCVLLGFFFGWIGLFFIWVFLKTRDKKTGFFK